MGNKQIVEAEFHKLAEKLLARQLVSAARELVRANEDAAQDAAQAKPGDPKLATEPDEKKFFSDKSKFGRQEDGAKLTNEMHDTARELDHAMRWLMSYYKQLKPAVEKFTKKLIRYDAGNINQSHMQQMAGVLQALMRLASTMSDAGATASDVVEMIQNMEKQLVYKPAEDARKSVRRSWWY